MQPVKSEATLAWENYYAEKRAGKVQTDTDGIRGYYHDSAGDLVMGPPILTSSEVIVTDQTTGGQKGQKLERFDLIPSEFETALARHYGKGAAKYADRNWERGYSWSLSVGALRRHLALWLEGEDYDPENGSSHLIAVAWHAIALFIFHRRGLGTDDIRRHQ